MLDLLPKLYQRLSPWLCSSAASKNFCSNTAKILFTQMSKLHSAACSDHPSPVCDWHEHVGKT